MRIRFAETYLRGRLARRLLMVFVMASVIPVLLASLLGYRQLIQGSDAASARALHDQAKESALALLSQLQSASVELALVRPREGAADNSQAPWPPPFSGISFVPVGTRAQWRYALTLVPEHARAALMRGRTVLTWTRADGGRLELSLIEPQFADARLALGTLDTRHMLDQSRPSDPGIGIAITDSSSGARLIRSDDDPVPRGAFEEMAATAARGTRARPWQGGNGAWRGSDWNLFLQSGFAAPPIRVLVGASNSHSTADLAGLSRTIPLMLLGAMAFAAWLAIAQLRRYLGPLETLTAATRRLGASDFDVEVHIETGDELSELGEDFNRMARSLREQHRQLQQRAHVDGLTGLSNRDFFRQRLRERLSCGQSSALLYVDLDEFKKVNDSAGHEAGDALLKEVASRLHGCVRPADTVARLGGDEFAIMLAPGASSADAVDTASRILRVVQEPIAVAGAERRVSASIGIALIPTDGDTEDLLLRNADIAMYQAKDRGRNGMAFFSAEMHRRMEQRISLEIALHEAIARGELRLHYQPITRSGQLAGVEALVRWRRSEGVEVSPAEFIPVAEQSGLILAIGDWVLERACADFAGWRADGIAPGYVSVNVSPRQLQAGGFQRRLQALLRERLIRPSELQLEMTESAMANGAQVALTLGRLHDLGVRLALDDFGTGYSSLSQLQQLPFDVVKIDRAFIVGLPENIVALQLVRTILGMTDSLGKVAVAEGVETEEQRRLLASLGCASMQGYFFGKPLPEREIREVLQAACGRASHPRAARQAGRQR